MDDKTNTVFIVPELPKPRLGPLIQRKIRKVCEICNRGWMKAIVDAAIPHAETVILGENTTLATHAQCKLSSWIALACTMAEFTDEKTIAIPPFDREFMMQNAEPPSDWHIYIGRYEGQDWTSTRYRHHGAKIGVLPPGELNIVGAEFHHYQVSTYVLGSLAVHAVSSTLPYIVDVFETGFIPANMLQIWPAKGDSAWPPGATLTDVDMNMIADSFANHMLAAHRRT